MRATLLAVIVSMLTLFATASHAQLRYSDWILVRQPSGGTVVPMALTRDNNFGKICGLRAQSCAYIARLSLECEIGQKYGVILSSDTTGGAEFDAECGGVDKGGRNIYLMPDVSRIDSLIQRSMSLEVGLPMEDGRTFAMRVSLKGAREALAAADTVLRTSPATAGQRLAVGRTTSKSTTVETVDGPVVILRDMAFAREQQRRVAAWDRAEAELAAQQAQEDALAASAPEPPPGRRKSNAKRDPSWRPPALNPPNVGAINPRTGEFYAPAGQGYVGTRDGTYYAPAGPSGVIDTRTGQFIPTH